MELDFLNVLFTVLFLVILVIPGYIAEKKNIFGDRADSVLSSLILYIAQPALMLVAFQNTEFSSAIAINMLIVAGITCVIHIIMIALMFLIVRGKEAKHNCVRTASIFSNCGYMGLPFLKLLFGADCSEILIYAAILISIFNFFNWSIGVFMISGDKKQINIKNILLNPTIISIFIGLIVFLIAKKPIIDLAENGSTLDMILEKFMKSINYLADMVTPLAMLVIGVKLAKINYRQILFDKWAYFTCFNKLILMSFVCILTVAFLPIAENIKYTVFFCLSMPCATSNVLFAVRFNGDSERASVIVLMTTILSILTIPVMFELFKILI